MKKIIFLLVGISSIFSSMRDPFNPVSDEVECSSGLVVRGIITSGEVRACVIGTGTSIATLQEGEAFDGLMVMKIALNEIVIKKDGELQTLVVK